MNVSDFEKKLAALPTEEPDELDRAMLAEAESMDDGTTVRLEAFRKELEEYSGRLILRIPRSLHKSLKEAAAAEGVSLNQYLVYKLSR